MLTRRRFIGTTTLVAGALVVTGAGAKAASSTGTPQMLATALPKGNSPAALPTPHFPSRLHAFIWRNWQLVPLKTMAKVVGASSSDLQRVGREMGLPKPPAISADQLRRSYITIIRRNWHLLPYEQSLELLGWTPEEMAFTLREDDFLYIKLGNHKPSCPPLRYQAADEQASARAKEIARILQEEFSGKLANSPAPLFSFVENLSAKPSSKRPIAKPASSFNPRFCYSYFALYGDPLLEPDADPYPDGYLARMAEAGVNGVWLQAVLQKLAPFPWNPGLSERYQERLKNLRALVARAKKYGIGIYLYLNEPRSMPLSFFDSHPNLKGITEGDHATLCTSVPEVQHFITGAISSICRAVPDLGGFFSITASENLTNCWSHGQGAKCPRCGKRSPGEVIAEVNSLFQTGIKQAGTKTQMIAWDWGWGDDWAPEAINRLPADVALMSVSEWSLPINRGGVPTSVGEYSISAVGPGPRAKRHWELARKRGLKTFAKIQAGCTWELSAVPYIPAVENVARHAANLRQAGVDGLMLGWTLGGYPSPNIEVVMDTGAAASPDPTQAMDTVARRRFGDTLAPGVVSAWRKFSTAFSEFPYHGSVVYQAPLQAGPSNLLWGDSTGYRATMVGIPYDDLDAWRAIYPPDTFIAQLEKVADGFDAAIAELKQAQSLKAGGREQTALAEELSVATAAAIHFRSVANQSRFTLARNKLKSAKTKAEALPLLDTLERSLRDELGLARRLYEVQACDSRIGFEASNHYFYVPLDLAEKVLNCRDLLARWLPQQRAKWT